MKEFKIKTTYRYRGKKTYNLQGEHEDHDGHMEYFNAQLSYDENPIVNIPWFYGDYHYSVALDLFGDDLPPEQIPHKTSFKQWLTDEARRLI